MFIVYFRHETEEPSLSKEEVDIDTVLREFFEDEDNGESLKLINQINFIFNLLLLLLIHENRQVCWNI